MYVCMYTAKLDIYLNKDESKIFFPWRWNEHPPKKLKLLDEDI